MLDQTLRGLSNCLCALDTAFVPLAPVLSKALARLDTVSLARLADCVCPALDAIVTALKGIGHDPQLKRIAEAVDPNLKRIADVLHGTTPIDTSTDAFVRRMIEDELLQADLAQLILV